MKAEIKLELAQNNYRFAEMEEANLKALYEAASRKRFEAKRAVDAAQAEVAKAAVMAAGEAALKDIDWSKAKRSYSGMAGRCCCGCSGNYSESKQGISGQISRLKKLAGQGVKLDIQDSYVAAENGGRLYIVYFN
jgi:hypothetical protein